MSYEEIKVSALGLDLKERASLAYELLETLEIPTKEELELLWVEEAENRLELVKQGKMRIIYGEETRRRVRKTVP
jgi:Putative addiction module component